MIYRKDRFSVENNISKKNIGKMNWICKRTSVGREKVEGNNNTITMMEITEKIELYILRSNVKPSEP
jgi:hypothetical protein